MLLVILFLIVDVIFVITSFLSFGSSFTFIFIVLVFPLDVLAVISTIPDFFVIISPVELIVAILSSLDFHVIFLSVALFGVIVTVNFLLSPTSILFILSFICIAVTLIVAVAVVVVVLFEDELDALLDDFEDEELVLFLLLDDELGEYGQIPLVCKCAGCPPQ